MCCQSTAASTHRHGERPRCRRRRAVPPLPQSGTHIRSIRTDHQTRLFCSRRCPTTASQFLQRPSACCRCHRRCYHQALHLAEIAVRCGKELHRQSRAWSSVLRAEASGCVSRCGVYYFEVSVHSHLLENCGRPTCIIRVAVRRRVCRARHRAPHCRAVL